MILKTKTCCEYIVKNVPPGGTLNTGGGGGLIFYTKDCKKASPAGSLFNYKHCQMGTYSSDRKRERTENLFVTYKINYREDFQATDVENAGLNPCTQDARSSSINPYTGIVELASSPGHQSSDSALKRNQLQLSFQGEVPDADPRTPDPRRQRINPYTGIVELASAPGHKSSDSNVQLNSPKLDTQDWDEIRGTWGIEHHLGGKQKCV